jgi:D-alanine-D-alanine ligase
MRMNENKNMTVAVIFGGRSAEHEVSVITAHQAMDALQVAGYKLLPIYITKSGEWYAGESLHNLRFFLADKLDPSKTPDVFKVSLSPDPSVRELIHHPSARRSIFRSKPKLWADVFFPIIHGTTGEDGAIEGLLEMANVPFVGSGIAASATGFDKILMKAIYANSGIPILECESVTRQEWQQSPDRSIAKIHEKFSFPVVVKPVCLGSSIGVSRCENDHALRGAIEIALRLDDRALVEEALTSFVEINCSVVGPPSEASVCEQPVFRDSVLSFDSKYKQGAKSAKTGPSKGGMASLGRIVPAPISDELTARIKDLSIKAFDLIGSAGVARIDFLYLPAEEKLYLNEINTMPGSLAFYLWEYSGLPFDTLVTKLINIGMARYATKQDTDFSFSANLLSKAT